MPKKSLARRRAAGTVRTKAPSLVDRSPTLRLLRGAWRGARKAIATGVQFVGSPDWTNVIRIEGGASPEAEKLTRQIAFATSAYCYTAIMYRASKIAEPPLYVVEDSEEGEREVEDHPRSMLLREPSPDYDMGELLQLTEAYRCVTGAALWKVDLDVSGEPGRIVPLSGDEFVTKRAGDRIYGRFVRVNRDEEYAPEEVIFFREPNPSSWRRNLSKLEVALSLLDLGHQVDRTVRSFMRKAIFPGGVISPDPEWHPDDDEWERFKNTIDAWHSGPENAGESLVVEGGTTFSRTALALEDLLPEPVMDRIEATVGSVFGVPPVVLGWLVGLKNSPWSQMGEARQMTYEDTIEPAWRDYERKIERGILERMEREAGRKIRFDTSNVRAFQQDDLTRAQVSTQNADIWTVNERRIYTSQDPLPDDDPRGSEIVGGRMSFGDVPVPTSPRRPASSTDDEGDEDDEEPPESDDEDEGASLPEHVRDLLAKKALGTISKEDLVWLNFEVTTKAAESTWVRGISGALDDLKAKTLALANRTLRGKGMPEPGSSEALLDPEYQAKLATKEVDPDSLVEFLLVFKELIATEGEEILRDAALPLIRSTGRQGVQSIGSALGLTYTTLEPGLLDFVEEEGDFLASVMGETTGRDVARIVESTISEGGTIREVRKALEESASFSRTRAQLTARTETTRAWNGAQRRSLSKWQEGQADDVQAVKQWLSSRDPRVRPEHDALDDGTQIRIDELFANGLQQPGEPNCRCTLLYDILRGEE